MSQDEDGSFKRGEKDDERGDVGPDPRLRAWGELRGAKLHVQGEKRELQFHAPPAHHYVDLLRQWRVQRSLAQGKGANVPSTGSTLPPGPTPPAPPPATNWIPIGPSVVRHGQASGGPAVSGRAVDVAIAPGGSRVYLATANGGVWRSDNGGTSWRSLMDSFDVDPVYVDADSLSCGAIAIDPASPDRVYVGTGEGESAIFFNGLFGVVYSYAGVGPLRNDSGGDGAWVTEPIASGSPTLNGQAFYALAIDPVDRERVVGATTAGIYRREPDGVGGYHWNRHQAGNCTSVVVSRSGGTTRWCAAMANGTMLQSSDGAAWSALGTGFPGSSGRVSLAVQPTNTGLVYSFSSIGVHRLDTSGGVWHAVSSAVVSDGYRAAIAVDPTDATRVFLGTLGITRGSVSSSGTGATLTYSMTTSSVGASVHADIHRLVIRSGVAAELWVACDGGAFQSTHATTAATFRARNTGISSVTCTYFDQHPSEAAALFCGVQDNGTLRYTGEEAWLRSADGDGGHVVVNWNDPFKVLSSYVYLPPAYTAPISRATDGGAGPGSWSSASPTLTGGLFYPALAGAPVNTAAPGEAERVALGADKTWFSDTFGTSWVTPDTTALSGNVSALAYANGTRVYAGTTSGNVYSYTRTGATWGARVLIGHVGGTALGLAPVVTAIAIDPADTTGNSFYVALGGQGNWQRVWHYNGTAWAARSGPSAGASTSLLAVHFNALVADPSPAHPLTLYAGADIGIWRSTDGGANWTAYADGLPDAGVTDLKIHLTRRLLRAATYGRGMWERDIDATSAAGVELYARDTSLDVGRFTTVDWLADPEDKTALVRHWESPNIKVDPPASSGTYQATRNIDFFQFVDQIVDGSEGVATVNTAVGTAINRVYVEVHNRGVTPADGVRVMLLLANASAGLPALPGGYATNVQNGTTLTTAVWQTVGFQTINGLRVGLPQVVEFDLPSTMLPAPAALATQSHYCLLALLHHPSDQFNSTQTSVDALTVTDRKVAQKNLHIVAFTGTLPPADAPAAPLAPETALIEFSDVEGRGRPIDLVLDTRAFTGHVAMLLPKSLHGSVLDRTIAGGERIAAGHFDALVKRQLDTIDHLTRESRTHVARARESRAHLERLIGGHAIRFKSDGKRRFLGVAGLHLRHTERALLVFEPPHGAKLGDTWELAVMQVADRTILGGNTFRCRVTLAPDDECAIHIATHLSGPAPAEHVHLHVRLEVEGHPVHGARGDKAEVHAVRFTPAGIVQPIRQLLWDAERTAFVLPLDRQGADRGVRRITVVARIGALEGRKTITLNDTEE